MDKKYTKQENYIYPVRVSKTDEGYDIEFIDFDGQYTQAETKEEIVSEAQDFLALTIADYVDEERPLPKPSKDLDDVLYIHIWLPYYRAKIKEVYDKKTLTIPQWIDVLAMEKNINFSGALVRGLKKELKQKKQNNDRND